MVTGLSNGHNEVSNLDPQIPKTPSDPPTPGPLPLLDLPAINFTPITPRKSSVHSFGPYSIGWANIEYIEYRIPFDGQK